VTAIAQRTRLELLQAKEAELAIEVDAARARIVEYPALLHDARSRAIDAKPNVRPGAELNGEVAKIMARERKDLAALNGLEGDLSAVRSVIAVEAARVAEEETAVARAQTQELHAKEEAVWKQAGELLGELASVWNSYVELAEEEDRFASVNGLGASGVLAVEPAPLSFKSWLLLLHKAATDPEVRLEPYEEQLIDAGTFRTEHGGVVYDVRPAGTRQVEVRRKLDYGDRLVHVVPDLRSVVRALVLLGHVPTMPAE
jgi:hypothetical protein